MCLMFNLFSDLSLHIFLFLFYILLSEFHKIADIFISECILNVISLLMRIKVVIFSSQSAVVQPVPLTTFIV